MTESLFAHVTAVADDPILSLTGKFLADPRECKINLGVGMYLNEIGVTPVLDVVKEAEEVIALEHRPHTYIPQTGLPLYDRLVQELIFGKDNEIVRSKRACTVQTLDGTGALKLGIDLMHLACGVNLGAASQPTWTNHYDLLRLSGCTVTSYRYYDGVTNSVDFYAMAVDLKALPENTLVILHACCHNPTGYDLTLDQWKEVIEICRSHHLIPFLDMTYQGFKQGLEEDAQTIRLFAGSGLDILAASSYSKSFNLYGERIGALTVVTHSEDQARRVTSHLKTCARAIYSNPPTFGGRIVERVLADPEKFTHWEQELAGMRNRILAMRKALTDEMKAIGAKRDFSFVTQQAGMFSFTGLTPEQVDRLPSEFGIYAVRNGRICICGLNEKNVSYVARSFATVL